MSDYRQDQWRHIISGNPLSSMIDYLDFEYEQRIPYYTPSQKLQEEEESEESEEDDDAIDTYEDDDSDGDTSCEEEMDKIPHWKVWVALLDSVEPVDPAHGYSHEPAEGGPILERGGYKDPDDRTAFFWAQKDWANQPGCRPPTLERWEGPRDAPEYRIGVMKFRGKVVTDWEGHAIRGFKNIPVCISSNVEGWRVEAWMRADARLKWSDIIARMRTKPTPAGRVPFYPFTALTKRAQLFRQKSALITWTGRKADTQINKDFVDRIRRAEMTPEQIARNRALPRNLTAEEFAQLLDLTKTRPISKAAFAAARKAFNSAKRSTKSKKGQKNGAESTIMPPGKTKRVNSNRMNVKERAATRSVSPANRRIGTRSTTKIGANQGTTIGESQKSLDLPTSSQRNLIKDIFISNDEFVANYALSQ